MKFFIVKAIEDREIFVVLVIINNCLTLSYLQLKLLSIMQDALEILNTEGKDKA